MFGIITLTYVLILPVTASGLFLLYLGHSYHIFLLRFLGFVLGVVIGLCIGAISQNIAVAIVASGILGLTGLAIVEIGGHLTYFFVVLSIFLSEHIFMYTTFLLK